ncbi:MAG: Hsp20/alpha crystallin family protein [Oscillospiraceae bacterium]|nr:Hsp20/alpha crystallin family protein [Oscillospiraceae bacterium]
MFELTPFGYRRVSAYNPFRELEEMSRSFWNDTELTAFRTDIKKQDGNYILEAELPGFKKEDISIDIDKDCLTISAEHKSEENEDDKDKGFIRRERYYGSYRRSFNIKGIDADAISASYNDGVLTLTMPEKTPEIPAARRLEIQ